MRECWSVERRLLHPPRGRRRSRSSFCPPLPDLPCPNCGENLLAEGFYNSCAETTRVHEDNRTCILSGRLYMDHDEETLDTIDHECDVDAYCRGCEKLLPWAL